jgi:putative IMPACT (imprinted ancient) family translation regulator
VVSVYSTIARDGEAEIEVLRGHDGAGVSDVVVVVTRWFGGTLLGAGGLVRAYSDAVRAGLGEVGTRRRELLREFTVDVGHDVAGRLETDLRSAGVAVLGTSYGASVLLTVGAPPSDEARLAALVAELTAGAGVIVPGEERWVDR